MTPERYYVDVWIDGRLRFTTHGTPDDVLREALREFPRRAIEIRDAADTPPIEADSNAPTDRLSQ